MRITSIDIQNFRSIRQLSVDLGETTVFVGPNNAGKTAILDALRLAMSPRRGSRSRRFNEYDVHLTDDAADPKQSSGVSIEIRSAESQSGEWPNTEDLGDIIQLDLNTDRKSISLRTRYAWSSETDAFEPSCEFLDARRDSLVGSGSASRDNLNRFWRYLPVFYLSALRAADDEFLPRSSQFWGRLLRSLKIPQDTEIQTLEDLNLINDRLLGADPRLEQIATTLSGATKIAARDREGGVALRMMPLKTLEILSRAQVILRNEPDSPWLPLRHQGQGTQSLSVVFLFQAFVEALLEELHGPESNPILVLEEPETHLHPQAVRTLWAHIQALPGQKIITTHSPYFAQYVPFRDLRLVRRTTNGTEVRSLPTSFSAVLPPCNDLESVVDGSNGLLSYENASTTLTVTGVLDERSYRRLLTCYGRHAHCAKVEEALKELRDRSSRYINDAELRSLETHARRMRGEIFFAERWLIVEGQTDYLIVHAMAHALGYDLDKHSVSVVDAQNNGSPASFAALARALDIPWQAVFDGDQEGQKFIRGIAKRGFTAAEVQEQCRTHEAGDLEAQLVADGLGPYLRCTQGLPGVRSLETLDDEALVECLRKNKLAYAATFAARLRDDASIARSAPEAFQSAITKLCG